jgi:hypothetical protein
MLLITTAHKIHKAQQLFIKYTIRLSILFLFCDSCCAIGSFFIQMVSLYPYPEMEMNGFMSLICSELKSKSYLLNHE